MLLTAMAAAKRGMAIIMPEQYRISLYLFYYEEYSAREIAQVMGKSEANITQYLSRGRRKLRTLLTEERSQVV